MTDPAAPPFAIFRAADATDFDEAGIMSPVAPPAGSGTPDPRVIAAMGSAMARGVMAGTKVRLLFKRPGLSLSHAWFKSGFPLPRHSHDTDCLYFILSGSLRIGTEELAKGDGFFVGDGVPYSYVPGPDGVEVLEFRSADAFDIKLLAGNPAWWEKALERLDEVQASWPTQLAPPSGIAFGG